MHIGGGRERMFYPDSFRQHRENKAGFTGLIGM